MDEVFCEILRSLASDGKRHLSALACSTRCLVSTIVGLGGDSGGDDVVPQADASEGGSL